MLCTPLSTFSLPNTKSFANVHLNKHDYNQRKQSIAELDIAVKLKELNESFEKDWQQH